MTYVAVNETWQQDPETPYQCVVSPGRLGNVMFGYASSLGVAAMANRTMVVDPGNTLLPHFKIKAVVDCDNTLCRSPKKKSQGSCCIFRPNLLEPEVDQPVLKVGTFLQSWRFFAHVEADIRRQFTAYGSTAKRAADTMRGLHREFDTAEGAARKEAEDLPAQSMDKANLISRKRRTRKEHSKVVPVAGAHCRYAGSTDRAVDLVVLGSCDHFIMSVGTFGWWAGWLTGGTVVYYKYPAKEGSKLRRKMNYDDHDFFPPNWIPMEWREDSRVKNK
ncbi:galactoside alpha-(1,2)-fucosyltransferase 1-like [Littorina saxatilis]|uniref:galactoside alpha-(1,2)-fucosyltransferase 1-like n=1 Tax=Littorina saxatilis TaxID=31220 RepID=UPI0038B54DE8